MTSDNEPPPHREPIPVQCLFVTGADCEITDAFVRIVAFVDLPDLPGEPQERRVVARLVLPTDVARTLVGELKRGLKKGSN